MVTLRRLVLASAILALSSIGRPSTAAAHDLHTTLTEITRDAARPALRVMVRAFADDYARGARASGRAIGGDSLEYIRRSLVIMANGQPLALRSCGTRRSGDLLWFCLESGLPASTATLSVRNAILCEVFPDQVNVVRVRLGSLERSLLFTRGDGLKQLR